MTRIVTKDVNGDPVTKDYATYVGDPSPLKKEVVMFREKVVDSARINFRAVGDTIADRIDRDTATVNIFVDTSVHFKLLNGLFYHIASYRASWNKKTNFTCGLTLDI